MILSTIATKLKSRSKDASKDDFKGRHFEAGLIVQAVSSYPRYPLSYRDIEELRACRKLSSLFQIGLGLAHFRSSLTSENPKQNPSVRFCSTTVQDPARHYCMGR